MKTKSRTLPDLPSEILRVALKDLEIVEKMPNVSINMYTWFEGQGSKECQVCHAGAVMLNTLKVKGDYCEPFSMGISLNRKLQFINFIRVGKIGDALRVLLNVPTKKIHELVNTISYVTDGSEGMEIYIEPDVYSYRTHRKQEYKNYISMMIGIFEAEGL